MIERGDVVARSALHPFIMAHACPGLGADPLFLLDLARGPDSVFDLHDGRGRALVAVLTDLCDNSGDAAELMLVASRDDILHADMFAAMLDHAVAAARNGPHAFLEIVAGPLVSPHLASLASRGFARRFEMMAMEKRRPHAVVDARAPWTWRDLAANDHAALSALGRAAFAGHPGVNFPPDGHGDESLLRRVPPIRLLWSDEGLIGSTSVRRDTDATGFIEIIQRHPRYTGQGVGSALLSEALRLLDDIGCRTVRLEAAVENRRALALYERFGFTVVETMPVLGLPTP